MSLEIKCGTNLLELPINDLDIWLENNRPVKGESDTIWQFVSIVFSLRGFPKNSLIKAIVGETLVLEKRN